jgi:K+-transporting ATPase c subunit
MARKNERRARENATAAKELATLKQQGMSDLERAQTERDEAKRERDEARADHSRVMAAATHDLPVELIDYLGSGTDEEISERAEVIGGAIETRAQKIAEARVQEALAQQGGGRNGFQGVSRPVESMRAGSAPSGGSEPRDSNSWFRALVRPGD